MRDSGIPCIYGLDQNHGTTYTMGGTLFPLKHYMGYSVPFTGKDRTPVYISAQDLREKHFAPFLACVKAGALSVGKFVFCQRIARTRQLRTLDPMAERRTELGWSTCHGLG